LAVPPGFKLEVRKAGDVCIVDLEGDLDVPVLPSFGQEIAKLIGDGEKKLLINLSKVGYVNSTAAALIMKRWNEIRRSGGDLRLFGASNYNKTIFHLLGLEKKITLYDSEEEAIEGFKD
jgi:anti-anti-sigma factor